MTSPLQIAHGVPAPELALGLVLVEGLEVGPAPAELAAALEARVAARSEGALVAEEERRRTAVAGETFTLVFGEHSKE